MTYVDRPLGREPDRVRFVKIGETPEGDDILIPLVAAQGAVDSDGDGLALEVTLFRKFGSVTPEPFVFSTAGDHPLKAPASGSRLQLPFLYAQGGPAISGSVEVTFKTDAPRDLYNFTLEASQPWMRTPTLDLEPDEALLVELDSDKIVRVGIETRELGP